MSTKLEHYGSDLALAAVYTCLLILLTLDQLILFTHPLGVYLLALLVSGVLNLFILLSSLKFFLHFLFGVIVRFPFFFFFNIKKIFFHIFVCTACHQIIHCVYKTVQLIAPFLAIFVFYTFLFLRRQSSLGFAAVFRVSALYLINPLTSLFFLFFKL